MIPDKSNSEDRIIKKEMGGTCGTCGARKEKYRWFGGETCKKGPHGRSRRKSVANVKKSLKKKKGVEYVDWINLAQDEERRWILVNIKSGRFLE